MAISRRFPRTVAAIATACALALPTATANAQAPIDDLGRPAPHILQQIEGIAKNPLLPEKVQSSLERLVGFIRGDGEPGVEVPEDAPAFTQFGWPVIAGKCINGESNAVGTAMAVPGPAHLPLPGVAAGEVNFVFTALGTGGVAKNQTTAMNVHWLNVNTGKTGSTKLGYTGINPEGPATINGAAQTGSGFVLAILEGGVTTTNEGAADSNCNFTPTAAIIRVP